MCKIAALFLFVMINLLPLAEVVARPEISIPKTVEVSQRPHLRLGDIAVLKNGEPDILAQIESLVLREDARGLLLSQFIESSEILKAFKAELEENEILKKSNPIFKIPSRIQIKFSTTLISKEEVERKILNVLGTRCLDCEFRMSIQSVPEPNTRDWELDFSQMTVKGGMLVPVKESRDHGLKWVSGLIRISRLTPVTTRMISQGERITASDLQTSMTDVTFAKDQVLRIQDIQGQVAARALPVGTPVWNGDIKREPTTKKGQIVKGLMGDGSFEIAVDVESQENGFVGDTVKVKYPDANKVFSAQVIDKGLVRLQ